MAKPIVFLGAAIAACLVSMPALAHQDDAARYGPADTAYAAQDQEASQNGRAFESRSVETHAYGYRASQMRFIPAAGWRRAHHATTDAAGYLSWDGKTDDLGPGETQAPDDGYGAPPPAMADGPGGYTDGGPGCPVARGERVLSCRYIPFTPAADEQPVAIADEDFAYEGSAGPVVVSGGGGGGGGGGGFAGGGQGSAFSGSNANASSFASSQAYASAKASLSANINIQTHIGGGYGGGGYGGGGYGGGGHGGGGYGGGGYGGGSGWGHMGGGHGSSGCGCKK